ncbi:hypothetical protein FB567DRAFT_614522, partial [Paraphoma chrysanthemicola]
DGRVMPLVVQATDLVYLGTPNSTWDRTFVRNTSPLVVRLASWTIDQLLDTRGWTKRDWARLVCQWAFSCLGLIPLLPLHFISSSVKVRNGAKYDPFRYRDWHYCKAPRNIHETNPSLKHVMITESHITRRGNLGDSFSPKHYRTLRPRLLCFLREPNKAEMCGFDTKLVENWMSENNAESHPDYIFVAWTKLQFATRSDKLELLRIAERAARDAQLAAFWCSIVCLPDEGADGLIEDVWRMSDIVRGSKKTAIVLGRPSGGAEAHISTATKDMLMGWGRRMWTLPEALLSPKGEQISIYTRGKRYHRTVEKRSLAAQIWEDAPISRQLMDHFEGSLILSPLELVVIALQCLNNRDTNDFSIGGEMAYVLMGLLRRRPKVDLTDSAFQAFARLSLANDNNMLLERLICVMPKHHHQAWHDTSDCYDAKLFDIYPTCQIAGVGNDDSVVLDGAQGASIRWDRFERVAYTNKDSFKRSASRVVLQLSPLVLLIGIILAVGNQKAAGILLLILALAILGASPYLIRLLFTGKLWDTQALLFGFEGYMDIATIETHIFGAYMNRLTWSPYGSTLSRHAPGEHGECIGLDPTTDAETAKLVANACTANNSPDDLKVFTLVDTFTMTVVMFLAERPPVVALLCGSEGGMQRAVLCSYQSSTQTLCREAVLRMETRTAERFWLVGRLRFAFKRSMVAV